ncbi:MAG: formylglycine-generating enzyme family protein [Gemmataceae bacterium]
MMVCLQRSSLAAAVVVALFLGLTRTEADVPKTTVDAKKHESYVEKLPDSKVNFEMIAIPGGTYMMGSPTSEKGRNPDEGPQHPITVKPIWMGKCEVSWDEFDLYWQDARAKREKMPPKNLKDDAVTGPTPAYVDETYGHGREGHPVLCMTHHCAMDYCRWLSAKTGKEYRLPTEAEWEWACRAGTTTPYFFGDDPAKLGEYAWYVKNSEDFTHKLASKKPNPWGLYDMYGNVYEWCIDHYEKDGYAKFPLDKPTLQPVVLPTAKRFSHVARGGSWADEPAQCRSASRVGSTTEWIKHDPQRPQSIWWLTKWDVVGFRVVRAVEEQPNLKGLRSKITKESD